MSILRPLVGARRGIENPQLPLTSVALAEWIAGGRSSAGVAVGEGRAYGISAYYRSIALLAGTMAQLPINVYRRGTRQLITQRTVLNNPNSVQTPFEFWQTTIANAVSWGTAYARKIRNGADVVTEVWPIHPSRVQVDWIEDAEGRVDKLFIVTLRSGEQRRWRSWDVFSLPYLSIDGLVGLSPMRLARETLGITIAAEEYAARFYAQGSLQSGVLTTDQVIDDKKAAQLKARWRAKAVGLANAHEVAVLDSGTKFQPLTIPPEDAQLLTTRQWQVEEIARLFGVPPHLLGISEKQTSYGAGVEQQVIGLLQFNLQSWLTMIAQRCTADLLPGGWNNGSWFAEHDIDTLLKADSTARAQFYAQAIQWGWMNRNEVRAKENLEPQDELEEFLTPSNMTLVTVNGQMVPLGGTGAQGDPNASSAA